MFGFPTNFEQLYDTGKELGRGTFGTTYVCTKKGVSAEERAKHTYAVKVILKSSLQGEGDIEDVKREVKIMELLKNKSHVVLLEGAKGGSPKELFQRGLNKPKKRGNSTRQGPYGLGCGCRPWPVMYTKFSGLAHFSTNALLSQTQQR